MEMMNPNLQSPLNEGAFLLFHAGFTYLPYEYTGYADEIVASKTSAYLGISLNGSPIYDVKGSDATKFMNSICVNNFDNMKNNSIKHAIICNEKGQILTDGVAMKLADDHFRTYWLLPVIDFFLIKSGMNVEGVMMSGQEFFFQLAGPKSLEILEQACESDLHDIKFAKHRVATIAGKSVRILRLGMSGTLAYEIHGDMTDADIVYSKIWENAAPTGAKKLGNVAYCMNHTEAGFPNINMHYPLPWYEDPELAAYLNERMGAGYYNMNRILLGSVGQDVEKRFKNPYQCGWGHKVKFDHDFVGRNALEKIAQEDKTRLVTLEWNADDVADIYASQFRGGDVEPYYNIDDRPNDIYFNVQGFEFYYHADLVFSDGKEIGTSAGRLKSVYYKRMISLGFIDKEYAVEGKELTVLWGAPNTKQKEVRVTVARCPYVDFINNNAVDVETIPHYKN